MRSPGEPLRHGVMEMVQKANARVVALSPEQLEQARQEPDVLVVDIRDPRELEREGQIPGAFRAPRGMVEFWVDPQSPYYKPALDDGRRLVLYCGAGWRSALTAATLMDMGRDDVAHLDGGFAAWKDSGLPVERRD